MRRGSLFVGTLLAALAPGAIDAVAGPDALEFGRFGRVALHRESEQPARVVLFLSGDGGWNQGVVGMASALASEGALVVGIDVVHYLRELARAKEECAYPAADFEALSQFVQKTLAFPRYEIPILVGYSSGATLAYATLAQAPPNTFRGAISLGFCPDLALPRPPCRGHVLAFERTPDGRAFRVLPAPSLETPWIALQGQIDQVCDATRTESFAKEVGHGEIVLLPNVGHGFSVERNWMPQLRASVAKLSDSAALVGGRRPEAGEATAPVVDLPLVEVPAIDGRGDLLAVIVSGDGGWASLDREVAQVLAASGIPVVGLDSLQYFWTRRTPEEAGRALERILDHYLAGWGRERAILVGYSRGADVLPFMARRLSPRLLAKVALVALLGPGEEVDFQFHLTDWFSDSSRATSLPVRSEVERLRGRRILCVFGRDETDSLCPRLEKGLAILDERPGAHHFGGDYEAIARRILAEAGR